MTLGEKSYFDKTLGKGKLLSHVALNLCQSKFRTFLQHWLEILSMISMILFSRLDWGPPLFLHRQECLHLRFQSQFDVRKMYLLLLLQRQWLNTSITFCDFSNLISDTLYCNKRGNCTLNTWKFIPKYNQVMNYLSR